MNKITMLLSSAVLLGLVSCNKSEFDGFTKAENGLHYQFFNQDESGVKAVEGDGVSIKIVYALKRTPTDSVLFDSKMNSEDGTGTVRYILPKSSFSGSLEDAIKMMAKNDSAAFVISADSFFLKVGMQGLILYLNVRHHIDLSDGIFPVHGRPKGFFINLHQFQFKFAAGFKGT